MTAEPEVQPFEVVPFTISKPKSVDDYKGCNAINCIKIFFVPFLKMESYMKSNLALEISVAQSVFVCFSCSEGKLC